MSIAHDFGQTLADALHRLRDVDRIDLFDRSRHVKSFQVLIDSSNTTATQIHTDLILPIDLPRKTLRPCPFSVDFSQAVPHEVEEFQGKVRDRMFDHNLGFDMVGSDIAA